MPNIKKKHSMLLDCFKSENKVSSAFELGIRCGAMRLSFDEP